MLHEVKGAVLRDCWLHIWFRFNVTGRSRGGTALASRFFLAVIINAIAHRCAPLFEVGDLSSEKGDTDMGGLNFRGQPASHLFAGLRFCANYRILRRTDSLFDRELILKQSGFPGTQTKVRSTRRKFEPTFTHCNNEKTGKVRSNEN